MGQSNIIRLTKDVEVHPNTVETPTILKKRAARERVEREEFGSVLKKGTLLREWHDSGRIIDGKKSPRTFTEQPDSRGYHRLIEDDAFEIVKPWEAKAQDFDFLLKAMCKGAFELPNFEPVYSDDAVAMTKLISNIASGGGASATGVAHILLPLEHAPTPYDQHSRWARLFPWHTQGGKLDGRGSILLYDTSYGRKRVPIGGTYSLCAHTYVGQDTAEMRMRGNHRGRCSKCGLDMSVDSSG